MGRTPPGQTRERVFKLVRDRLLAGLPPTVREVQQAFGFRAVQTAREHLEALVEEGRLSKEGGKARGYRLPESEQAGPPTRLVPLLGRVQAGVLNYAVEDLEGYVPVQSRRSPNTTGHRFSARSDASVSGGWKACTMEAQRRETNSPHSAAKCAGRFRPISATFSVSASPT